MKGPSRSFFAFFLFGITFILPSFLFAGDIQMTHIDFANISQEKKVALSEKKIFFGHQSVGNNILNGVNDLIQSGQVKLEIVETADPRQIKDQGVLAHKKIGENMDPLSKVAEFKAVMDSGLGEKIDIAFMKFCYVDIGTQTDTESVFAIYQKTLAELKTRYPKIIFVHFTVPLVSEPEGVKSIAKLYIKKLIQRNDMFENTSKAKFNALLRKTYSGREPIFDLAALEATYKNGSKLTYTDSGQTYEALIPDYTDDGGHLNKEGRLLIAEDLLSFLANLD